ncbi:MAG TPA: hypothetical protein VEX68_22310 [Bryobacteraceae bacterium]|nr:hypothetical protein [Bryobacteraceae bacterium]
MVNTNVKSAVTLLLVAFALSAQDPSRNDAPQAMRKASDFYRGEVSTEGGYHYFYTADLSYGRSEHGEGLTQIEVQREATPTLLSHISTPGRLRATAPFSNTRALLRRLWFEGNCAVAAGITSLSSIPQSARITSIGRYYAR